MGKLKSIKTEVDKSKADLSDDRQNLPSSKRKGFRKNKTFDTRRKFQKSITELKNILVNIWVNIIASFIFAGITVLVTQLTLDFDVIATLGVVVFVFSVTLFVGILLSQKFGRWPEERDRLGDRFISVRISPSDSVNSYNVDPKDSLLFQHEEEGSDGTHQTFILANISNQGIVVIRQISLIVERCARLRKKIDESVGAFMPTHYYSVVLDPNEIKEYIISSNEYKYTGGELDRFVISLISKETGYKYLFRFKIDWYDVRDMQNRTQYSNGLVAYFYKVNKFDSDINELQMIQDIKK